MDRIIYFVSSVRDYLWYFPMPVSLVATHLFFTVKTGFIQRKLLRGIRLSLRSGGGYMALASSLAATIGTGNIIGISAAVAIGGPGAVFWCWITGILGMATCYAECRLAMRYRSFDSAGRVWGGPMYVLEKGLKSRPLAVIFSVCTCVAALGIGSGVQSYSVRLACEQLAGMRSPVLSLTVGVVTAALTGVVILGGKYKAARVCMWLVPVMSAVYLLGCISVLIICRGNIIAALTAIVKASFMPEHLAKSLGGGAAGGGIMLAMRTGIARGLFTNEAGLGSVPMAAVMGSGDSDQALISMTGPFWDTVVMCAITGVAVVAAMLSHPELFAAASAEGYCFAAFEVLPLLGEEILAVSLILFAFATIIGWNVYGVTAFHYLFKGSHISIFQALYCIAALCGAVMTMTLVWSISDIFNACMAIPNLIALWGLWGYNKFHITTQK